MWFCWTSENSAEQTVEFHGTGQDSGCEILCRWPHMQIWTWCCCHKLCCGFFLQSTTPTTTAVAPIILPTMTTTSATHDGNTPTPKCTQACPTAPEQEPQTTWAWGHIAVGSNLSTCILVQPKQPKSTNTCFFFSWWTHWTIAFFNLFWHFLGFIHYVA